jgi:hypothetical protein
MKPGIEFVVVPPGLEGGVEALPELEVEHLEAEALDGFEVLRRAGEPHEITPGDALLGGQQVGTNGVRRECRSPVGGGGALGGSRSSGLQEAHPSTPFWRFTENVLKWGLVPLLNVPRIAVGARGLRAF